MITPKRRRIICLVLAATCLLGSACASTPAPSPTSRYDLPDDLDSLKATPQQLALRATKVHRQAQRALIQGKPLAARELYAKALGLYTKLGDPAAQASVHNDLALIDQRDGKLDDAEAHLNQALALGAKGDEPIVTAEARYNLAGLHYDRNRLDDATRLFTEAIRDATSLRQDDLLAMALNGRGNTHRRANNLAQALDDYGASIKAWYRIDRPRLAAIALMNIGYTLVLKGAYAEAADTFEQTIKLLQAHPAKRDATLIPHLQRLIRDIARDPGAARDSVLKLTFPETP